MINLWVQEKKEEKNITAKSFKLVLFPAGYFDKIIYFYVPYARIQLSITQLLHPDISWNNEKYSNMWFISFISFHHFQSDSPISNTSKHHIHKILYATIYPIEHDAQH